MTMSGKVLPLLVFLFCSVLVFASVGLGKEDPELKQCKHQCKVQQQLDRSEKQECLDRCDKYYKEKQERRERDVEGGDREDAWNPESPERKLRECERQCEQRGREEERRECQRQCLKEFRREEEEEEKQRGGGGGGRDGMVENKRDPEEQFRRCKEGCERQRGGQEVQRRCMERCEREHRQPHQHEGREEERGGGRGLEQENKKDPEAEEQFGRCKEQCQRQRAGQEQQQQRCRERCEREYEQQRRRGEGNPRREEGREEGEEESEGQQEKKPYGEVKASSRHENYRVAILEADPQTFIVPNHWDAEAIIFVAKGRGSISLVRHDKRESFNLNSGDVLRVPAGVTIYLINRSNNQQLVLVKLLQPVFTPGHFEAFFGPGGEDPESYYKAFSTELLEAALNTRRDRLEKIFGQQRQGVIIKASQEQIKAMSRHEEGGIWPFGEKSKAPFNLFHKRSSLSNQYGQLYEVDPSDCRDLDELDLGVGFANISEGTLRWHALTCPRRSLAAKEASNTAVAATKAGPPKLPQSEGATQARHGVLVPAGHPVIAVASDNQNLEILYFYVNARNNEKFLLAGRRNIINQLEREAKELGFGLPAREVDEVFRSQEEEFFLQGPRQQRHHEGRAEA
ncbi:hypothetical protein C3L33_04118, partial [Rhododendron williamsianum]